jgi:hypothetical protein
MLTSKISAAITGFVIANALSSVQMMIITSRNRQTEWDNNDKMGAPDQNHLYWTVIHIRDDIGGICSLLWLTNGLLAAIVAALLF